MPGFMVLQGNRLEALRDLMVTWMRRHPLDPLENEAILVQSNGIAQWLKLALAADPGEEGTGGCGIAAALEVMLPGRFLWRAYRSLLGDLPDTSAFDKAPLTWRLYRLLGDLDGLAAGLGDSDWLAPLRGFLPDPTDARRRHQLAARLADLYDQYQVYRADWLERWQDGDDVLIRSNDRDELLPARERWQAALWRSLRASVPQDGAGAGSPGELSRADIHRRFLREARRLGADPRTDCEQTVDALPRRVIVFGISSLPRHALEVLNAIARCSQVLLFVQNPSRHYWGDIVEGRELFRCPYRRNPERRIPEGLDEVALHLHGHPLLAAWGKQGRDYIRLLDEHDERAQYESLFATETLTTDLFESPGTACLLHQLQDDILALRPLAERQGLGTTIDPKVDRSLSFLVAHSSQREVEILHDQLLDAFEQARGSEHPLHPRDVLVMVPDINRYAPHIEAVFGRLSADDTRHIPFHVADLGRRHQNPLLLGVEALLALPQSRFSVSELLDLLDIPALRARFDLGETDLPGLRRWIAGANIRWGLDAEQREGLGLPAGREQNTWRFGLRRMLLGFAAGESAPWQGIEPYAEVGGLEAALAGHLVRLLDTLDRYTAKLREQRTTDDWTALIGQLLDDFFVPLGDADSLAVDQVHGALEQWVQDCRTGGIMGEALPLEVVREALLAGLDAPTLTQRFLAGAVNFATLMPMRAVPFRQIWLLGMNDGDYPRAIRPADFDLMADDYRPGDRSRREDDRYLFLEALLSARERLVISWVGRSIRDNAARPPSVLVGQLRDHIAAGWRPHEATDADAATGEKLVEALTTKHPLQPFSRRYFEPDRPAELFTYASEWRAIHTAQEAGSAAPTPLAPPKFEGPITLATLAKFLRYPVGHFYSQRLGAQFAKETESLEDDEAFEFDGLGSWALRDTVLGSVEGALAAASADPQAVLKAAVERLARAGQLPLPPFDDVWADALIAELAVPLKTYRSLLEQHVSLCSLGSLRVDATDITLEDTLPEVRADAAGNRLRLRLQASRLGEGKDLKWYHLARDWPLHLAAQLHGPTATRFLGPETDLMVPPLAADAARGLLSELLETYRECMTVLPPLACKTGFAVLQASEGIVANPTQVYEGGYDRDGEREDHPAYRRFWPSFENLNADKSFGQLVDRLYRPLFRHCRDQGRL